MFFPFTGGVRSVLVYAATIASFCLLRDSRAAFFSKRREASRLLGHKKCSMFLECEGGPVYRNPVRAFVSVDRYSRPSIRWSVLSCMLTYAVASLSLP